MNSQTTAHTAARRSLTVGAALLALVATGCAEEDTEAPEAASPDGSSQEEPLDTTPDGGTEDDGATGADAETDTGADTGPDSSPTVETVGESPYGLVTEEAPDGDTDTASGTLIVGPGGYLALTQQAQPQLLIFEDGADFTLRGDRPSVTTPELGTLEVGQETELTVVEVDRESLTDLLQDRLSGASDTALVVTGD